METPVSDIQVESKDETRSAEVRAQDERQEEKASMLCFKRRKKSAKAVKPKADSGAADEARECASGAGASDQPQPPAGAWASIKRLVTRRKRSGSSKQQKPSEAKVHPEVRTEDANLPKKKAKSRLRIPCIKFSKREKRHSHSESIEDADCSIQVQEEAEQLDTKTPTKSDDRAPQTEVTPEVSGEASQKGGEEVCEPNVSNSRTSPGENVISVEVGSEKGHSAIETGTLGENVISVEVGSEKGHFAIETGTLGENVISVELGLERGHSAIETGTLILEKDIETTEENQSIPPQQTSPLGTLETEHQLPVVSDAPRSPASPEQQIAEEDRNGVLESVPNGKDHESGEAVAEEIKPKDHELSQESDFKENETSAEKPKPEENKRMEPIAIIITDTEISEFDVKKSKNVPKQFLMSTENEKGGGFAECGFEGKTSEQYETLLIETASSLVKNAIQLSIEQLVNEMASGDNKINNLLQ